MLYRLNTPHVGSETINGETIMIDFLSGAYFSSEKLGAIIWEKIKCGMPSEQIIVEIQRHYPGREDCAAAVESFLAQLEREKLVVAGCGENQPLSVGDQDQESYPEQFSPPLLNKYTDMQDLLLLDPIHETDEQGWPVRRKPEVGDSTG